MKRPGNIILLLIVLSSFAARSQQPTQPDSLLNRLTGDWVLNGTIAGEATVHDITARRVLNGQYVQLTEVSREKDKNGNPAYAAIVYFCWQEPRKQYFCLWLDNTSNEGISNNVIGEATEQGDSIGWVFRYGDGTRFYNTFVYERKTDTWQWNLDNEEKGMLQPFARVKLTRR
jgi:hypothetical protein